MDDDFGDFTGFSSALGDSAAAAGLSKEPPAVTGVNMDAFTFDSLQGVDGGNGFQEFPDFSQFGVGDDSVHVAGGVMFDIPPLPLSPDLENFHMVGGVQFEVPPLPDFSPETTLTITGVPAVISDPVSTACNSNGTKDSSVAKNPDLAGIQDVSKPVEISSHFALDVLPPGQLLDAGFSQNHDTGSNGGGRGQSDALHTSNDASASTSDSFGEFSSSGIAAEDTSSYGAFSGFQPAIAASSSGLSNDISEGMASLPPPPEVAGGIQGVSAGLTATPSVNTRAAGSATGESASTTSGSGVGGGDFDAFSSNPIVTTVGGGGFGDFSANPVFSAAAEGGNGDDFGAFSASNTSEKMPEGDGFGVFAISSSDAKGDDDEFGGFSSGFTEAFSSNTAKAEGGSGGFSSGAGFGALASTATETKGEGEFGGFSSGAARERGDDFGGNAADTKGGDDEFGGFSSGPTATGDSDGQFGGFSSGPTATGDSGGQFGGFSSGPTATGDSGGEFGGFSSGPTATGDSDGQFGGFSSGPTATGGSGGGEATAAGGEFGEFGGAVGTREDDFGEFGEFSGSGTGSTETRGKPKVVSGSLGISTGSSPLSTSKSAVETLGLCFTGAAGLPKAPPPTLVPLAECVKDAAAHTKTINQGSENNPRLWKSLLNCLDLTVPLHKFDKSYMQDCYYHLALSVDPMLVSRPSTLSLLTGMARFEAPLGGATAVEDLRESFGFEGDLPQLSPTEQITSPFRRQSEGGAALLDLSLPMSPNSPTRDSFTLTADLAGLDLNPEPKQEKPLTSIQELLLNERLVVNRSTWMDSQLAELGGGASNETTPTSQPNTPRSARLQNTMESQLELLGLDVSKTTSIKTSNKELSLSARSVLGRLPDLSFMSLSDKMEKRTLYFSGSS